MGRIVQKLTAEAIECPSPDPGTHPASAVTRRPGGTGAPLDRATGGRHAVHEAAEAIPGFDADTWDLVLIELLAPTEGDRIVRDNVVDLGGVRLSRL
jgi:hypothetical protein